LLKIEGVSLENTVMLASLIASPFLKVDHESGIYNEGSYKQVRELGDPVQLV